MTYTMTNNLGKLGIDYRHTQLLFATGNERGIHNRQVLKYQPLAQMGIGSQ